MVNKPTISRAELAAKVGVTRAAVTKACKGPLQAAISGTKLDATHPAVVGYIKKKLTSKTLKAAKAAIVKKAEAATKKKTAAKKKTSQIAKRKKTIEATKAATAKKNAVSKEPPAAPKDPPASSSKESEAVNEEAARIQSYFHDDVEIESLLSMSLRDIVNQFGSGAQFKDYTTARKTLEEIRARRLKNQTTEGLVIPRELVSKTIFSALENTFLRLLQDSPRTITMRVMALAKAGGSLEDGIELVRGLMSTQLRGIKATAQRELKALDSD